MGYRQARSFSITQGAPLSVKSATAGLTYTFLAPNERTGVILSLEQFAFWLGRQRYQRLRSSELHSTNHSLEEENEVKRGQCCTGRRQSLGMKTGWLASGATWKIVEFFHTVQSGIARNCLICKAAHERSGLKYRDGLCMPFLEGSWKCHFTHIPTGHITQAQGMSSGFRTQSWC